MLADHRNLTHLDNQRGWVLVVGLVILVMLTILSTELMKTTRLEEKMVGATRDMNLSFQAAETALRAAETFIESQTTDTIFNSTVPANGIYRRQDDEPEDLFLPSTWTGNSAEIDGELEGVTVLPRYMIKRLRKKLSGALVFRITVRGTGGTNNRATLLRSHYAKKFGAGSSGPEGRLSWEQLFPSQ